MANGVPAKEYVLFIFMASWPTGSLQRSMVCLVISLVWVTSVVLGSVRFFKFGSRKVLERLEVVGY